MKLNPRLLVGGFLFSHFCRTMKPSVSIVVPCLNEESFLPGLFQSFLYQTYPDDSLTMMLVDGGSTDKSLKIAHDFALQNERLFVLKNPHKYTPHALNIGIRSSKTDVVIILGAHATMHPDFVKNSVESLFKEQSIMCSGGIINNVYQNQESENIGKAMSSSFGVGNATFRTGGKPGFVDTVAFGAYKRELFEEIGYFDEELIRNQDDEFNFRITKAGYKIYFNPEIKSDYYVRASYNKLKNQYYQYGYWKVFVNIKHKQITTIRQLVPMLLVLYIMLFPLLIVLPILYTKLYLLALGAYFVLGLMSAQKVAKSGIDMMQVWFAFLTLHFSYGFGYLSGIWDFVIRNKSASKKMSNSTR